MKYQKNHHDIFSTIKIHYNNLTPLEKSIADFFLNNKEELNFSAENVSQKLFTSKAALSRFAKKCGFSGYREFSYWYQEEFQHKKNNPLEAGTKLILDTYQELLNKSYSLINEEQIKKVAQLLSEKERIFIYGKGFSGVAAEEFSLRLTCIGIPAICITDTHMMAMNSALITPGSVVIGISVKGETKEIFYSLRKAKIQGAYTIAVSSIHQKQWNDFCDDVLLIPTKETLTLGKLISPQFPILVLFDILYGNILQNAKHVKTDFPEFILAELNENPQTYV